MPNSDQQQLTTKLKCEKLVDSLPPASLEAFVNMFQYCRITLRQFIQMQNTGLLPLQKGNMNGYDFAVIFRSD